MRDLISFVLRGACGGAAFILVLAIFLFGGMGGYWFLSPLYLVFTLLPRAVVGLFLWFIAGRADQPLTAGHRFSMGTAVAGAYLVVANVAQLALTLEATQLRNLDIPSMIMGLAVFAVSIGGLAGLLCPAGREHLNKQPEMTYRERARLYAEAEQEAKAARERIASLRVINYW